MLTSRRLRGVVFTDLERFTAGRGYRFFLYIIRRSEGGNYKGNGVGHNRDRWKLKKITEPFLSICTSSWFISKRTVICPCVRQHWRFSVWSAEHFGDLYLIAGTVIRSGGCALSSVSPWLAFEPWGTFYILIFSILWSYGIYCVTNLAISQNTPYTCVRINSNFPSKQVIVSK